MDRFTRANRTLKVNCELIIYAVARLWVLYSSSVHLLIEAKYST